MLKCFAVNTADAKTIVPLTNETFASWLSEQTDFVKNWVRAVNFTAKPESICLLPASDGSLASVLFGVKSYDDFWSFGLLSYSLPEGCYRLDKITDVSQLTLIAMAWGLGAYQFNRYKKNNNKTIAQLVIPAACAADQLNNNLAAIYTVRELINTPAEAMGPPQLAQAALDCAQPFQAAVSQIIGDDLLTENYPLIHAVGRAGPQAPRLIDLQWGDSQAPKITLVGKGVCFDTGGLDIKNSASMLFMRKDMGGAAHALGLAHMIMAAKLPIRLRVLIPAVENSVAGNAYRPGDIFTSRQGLTVEIGNTDSEGRLVLADALTAAVAEKPEILVDFSTLTGAARVAVGTDISAMFSNNDLLAEQILKHAQQQQDPICRMPLYAPYRKMIDSSFADINNSGASSYAGAITAALFLKEFVPDEIPWLHFDFMAWNLATRPGRPEGGEAMAIRAVFSYLAEKYAPELWEQNADFSGWE